ITSRMNLRTCDGFTKCRSERKSCTVRTFVASNPVSAVCIFSKLRIKRPALISITNARATCETISPLRSRRWITVALAPRPQTLGRDGRSHPVKGRQGRSEPEHCAAQNRDSYCERYHSTVELHGDISGKKDRQGSNCSGQGLEDRSQQGHRSIADGHTQSTAD